MTESEIDVCNVIREINQQIFVTSYVNIRNDIFLFFAKNCMKYKCVIFAWTGYVDVIHTFPLDV